MYQRLQPETHQTELLQIITRHILMVLSMRVEDSTVKLQKNSINYHGITILCHYMDSPLSFLAYGEFHLTLAVTQKKTLRIELLYNCYHLNVFALQNGFCFNRMLFKVKNILSMLTEC